MIDKDLGYHPNKKKKELPSRSDSKLKELENPSAPQETYKAYESTSLVQLIQDKSHRSRTSAKQLIVSRRVTVNGKVVGNPNDVVPSGSAVLVHVSEPPKAFFHHLLDIVWENESYVILYKKSGIATVNTAHRSKENTAIWILSQHYKKSSSYAKLFMLIRLDRDTEGYIMFAKSIEAKNEFNHQWHSIVRKQTFVCCVEGTISSAAFEIDGNFTKEERTDNSSKKHQATRMQSYHIGIDVLKSSDDKARHVVQIEIDSARLLPLRHILAEHNLVVFGDKRNATSYTTVSLLCQQIALVLAIPGRKSLLSFRRNIPTHYFSYLR